MKLLGAAAEDMWSFEDCLNLGTEVNEYLATIGTSLDHCHVLGRKAFERIPDDTCVVGMGIHNEPGHSRVPLPPLNDLIAQMFEMITSTNDPDRSFLPFKNKPGEDDVVLLVNNLGGISELELSGITGAATAVLEKKGVKVHRVLTGSFMVCLIEEEFYNIFD